MLWSIYALIFGAIIDFFAGDPHWLLHPVQVIGKLISILEKALRAVFPKTKLGENIAGGVLFFMVIGVSFMIPWIILYFCYRLKPGLGLVVEAIMCWQCLAARSLANESTKVKKALDSKDIEASRKALSMIVGRDTEALNEFGIARAAVETIAENTCDGVIAPLFSLVVGGAPLGMLYKAVNTMDSMLGYTDEPYRNFGLVPAKLDDAFNFIPARFSALIMLFAGWLQGLDLKNGIRIFKRDRYKHASPNSAQTESAVAGLLGLRLAGDAYYHGVLHKKEFIGDALREIEPEDIQRANKLMFLTFGISIVLLLFIKFAVAVVLTALVVQGVI